MYKYIHIHIHIRYLIPGGGVPIGLTRNRSIKQSIQILKRYT